MRGRMRSSLGVTRIDALFQDVRRAEHQDASGIDRDLFASLRVATNAFVLATHKKGTERRQFNRFTFNNTVNFSVICEIKNLRIRCFTSMSYY